MARSSGRAWVKHSDKISVISIASPYVVQRLEGVCCSKRGKSRHATCGRDNAQDTVLDESKRLAGFRRKYVGSSSRAGNTKDQNLRLFGTRVRYQLWIKPPLVLKLWWYYDSLPYTDIHNEYSRPRTPQDQETRPEEVHTSLVLRNDKETEPRELSNWSTPLTPTLELSSELRFYKNLKVVI